MILQLELSIMRTLLLFFGICLLNCSSADNYFSNQLSEDFTEIDIQLELSKDTLFLELFYDVGSSDDVLINQANSIVEVSKNKYWVSDFLGQVVELDNSGNFIATILETGSGPNEILKPIGMGKSPNGDIYVLDSALMAYVVLDTSGNEIRRVPTKSISTSVMVDQPTVLASNRILWKKILHPEFSLVEWDSLGNFSQGIIDNLVKPGETHVMLNNVVYDFDSSSNAFLYAYKPIPTLFERKSGKISRQINLVGSESDYDFNSKVTEIKNQNTNRVSNLIKEVFWLKDGILVAHENYVTYLPEGNFTQPKSYQLFNSNGEKAVYHYAGKTSAYLFLFDAFNKRIYRVNLNHFENN